MTQRPPLLSEEAGESWPHCHPHLVHTRTGTHGTRWPTWSHTLCFWVTTMQLCLSGLLWEAGGGLLWGMDALTHCLPL